MEQISKLQIMQYLKLMRSFSLIYQSFESDNGKLSTESISNFLQINIARNQMKKIKNN